MQIIKNVCFILVETSEVFHRPMNTRPRLLLLIPHLGGGGAERVTALLARGLSVDKYELHLGLITQSETDRLLRLIRRLKPDLILSGIFHLNFLVLLLRPFFARRTCILVRQNATVSATLAFGGLPGYTRLLYQHLYRHAERVICQSHAMANDLARELRDQETPVISGFHTPGEKDILEISLKGNGPVVI